MRVVDEESIAYISQGSMFTDQLSTYARRMNLHPMGNGVDSRAFPHGDSGGSRAMKIYPDVMIPRYVSTYRIYTRWDRI